jgi:hypothetical protein
VNSILSKLAHAKLGLNSRSRRPTLGLGTGCTPSVRAGRTGSSSCPTGWIGHSRVTDGFESRQAYLSVGRLIRISTHTKISSWAANPILGLDGQFCFDGLGWTSKSVRRVWNWVVKLLSEPLGLGFWALFHQVGLKKSVSEPNPTVTLFDTLLFECELYFVCYKNEVVANSKLVN